MCVVSNVPAVDKHRAFGWSVLFLNLPVEGQDGSGIIRHSMIRPGSEVELSHFQWTLRTSLELEKEREFHAQVEREGGREGGREGSHLHYQGSRGVVSQSLLVRHGDLEWSKVLGPALRPVLLALYLSPFLQVGHHNNGEWFLLPDQPPEVYQGLWERTCTSGHTLHVLLTHS